MSDQKTEPILLVYHGTSIIEKGDTILYKQSHDHVYTSAKVLNEWELQDGNPRVRIEALQTYKNNVTNISQGQIILASPNEIFWSRHTPLPADRLETILEMLSQRTGRGVEIMM